MGQMNQRSHYVEIVELLSTNPSPSGYAGASPTVKLLTKDGDVIEIPVPENKIDEVVKELEEKSDETKFHTSHYYL